MLSPGVYFGFSNLSRGKQWRSVQVWNFYYIGINKMNAFYAGWQKRKEKGYAASDRASTNNEDAT